MTPLIALNSKTNSSPHTFNFDPTYEFGDFDHNRQAEATDDHGSYDLLAPSNLQPLNIKTSLFHDNRDALSSGNASVSKRDSTTIRRS